MIFTNYSLYAGFVALVQPQSIQFLRPLIAHLRTPQTPQTQQTIFTIFTIFTIAITSALLSLFFVASSFAADVKNGETLYQENCMSCHGIAGVSVIPANPILAGNSQAYLQQAFSAYINSDRKNAIMIGMSKTITELQMEDVAAYLSAQNPVISGASSTAIEKIKAGKTLYSFGDSARSLPSCTGCHGPTGAGIVPLYPRISGQHAEYVKSALKQMQDENTWKSAEMNFIAQQLTDAEIENLAVYISGLSSAQ